MKQKARLKAIEKAARNKADMGRTVAEVVIYDKGDNRENRHFSAWPTGARVARVFIPDNGRGDARQAGKP